MTPSGEPEFRPRDEPSDGTAPSPAPLPLPLRQTESNLDWLENQKRSRRSKFVLDCAIIAITLLVTVALAWALFQIWKH
jgi:hypothetical protein